MTKLLGMIGMAKRAGRLSTGAFACEKMIRSKKARLVILATDAAPNTRKSITDSCEYYKIKYIEAADMESLGHAAGCPPLAAVSVNDNNFANAISDIYLMPKRERVM